MIKKKLLDKVENNNNRIIMEKNMHNIYIHIYIPGRTLNLSQTQQPSE